MLRVDQEGRIVDGGVGFIDEWFVFRSESFETLELERSFELGEESGPGTFVLIMVKFFGFWQE